MAFEEKTRGREAGEQAPAPELLQQLVGTLVQDSIRAEFDRFLGAARYERAATRRGYRNGSYPRTLQARVGALRLEIPRDRAGLFRASLLAKYERSEQALVLAMVEMYFHVALFELVCLMMAPAQGGAHREELPFLARNPVGLCLST